MWLLKLHFAVSILCLLTFIGFKTVGKEAIKNNGYKSNEKRKSILSYWIFFIPLLNFIIVLILFVMIGTKKVDLDKWIEEQREKKELNKS